MHYLLLLFTGFHYYLVDLVVVFMESWSPSIGRGESGARRMIGWTPCAISRKIIENTSTWVSVSGGDA